MSDQDKITAILAAIQDDQNLIMLIRALVTNNLPIVSSMQLHAMMVVLGLPET